MLLLGKYTHNISWGVLDLMWLIRGNKLDNTGPWKGDGEERGRGLMFREGGAVLLGRTIVGIRLYLYASEYHRH